MSSSQTTLGHSHSSFVVVEATDQIQAIGHVLPRVMFELRMRTPNERVQGEIHYLRMQVKFENEVLGIGSAAGEFVDSHDRRMKIEVPTSRTALGFVDANLSADRLDLTLSLQGWMRIRHDPAENERAFNTPPGEWSFTTFGVTSMCEIRLQIPRGEWFKRVLEPLGSCEYLLTEVPVLKGAAGNTLGASRRQLQEAERHFAEGNDPAVFQHCKGMIEALPGWPKEIFSSVVDKSKARHLDSLVHSAKQYFDHGRHIAQDGTHQGDFPVNHREALFALNIAKVLLSEVAAVVGGA